MTSRAESSTQRRTQRRTQERPGLTLAAATLVLPFLASGMADATTPETMTLTGVLRDFSAIHPDFGITSATDRGQYTWNVGPYLSGERRPVYGGGGSRVYSQWYDKDGNPIAPYPGDGGLPGGHFDVDVYDEATDREEYHKHEFDDAFDVVYIDIVNDPNLLFDDIIADGYPNDLRVEFLNPHNGGGGFYVFQAGGALETGATRDGFTATFDPALLTRLRVDFASLSALRNTRPGDSQDDIVDRDDAFAVRIYDTVTGELVYEIAAYQHGTSDDGGGGSGMSGTDACGVDFDDTVGVVGHSGAGAVTSAETFDQWYRDAPGVNVSRSQSIVLERDIDGVYSYVSDDFYPVDRQLLGNEGEAHNGNFTFSISGDFVYESCGGQFFEFEGSDDCWVFINGQRVIDIGGVATPDGQYVALDRLGLVDGEPYTLDFFFAHRGSVDDSVFRMRTNLELVTGTRFTTSAAFD